MHRAMAVTDTRGCLMGLAYVAVLDRVRPNDKMGQMMDIMLWKWRSGTYATAGKLKWWSTFKQRSGVW